MKIAVCLSGQQRVIKYTWQSLQKYLIEPSNADLFIFSWLEQDNTILVDKLKPIAIKLEDYDSWLKQDGPQNSSIPSLYPMWYGINQANKLKTAQEEIVGQKYDVVIRTRTDNLFVEPIPENELKQIIEGTKSLFIKGNADPFKMPRPYANDIFAFGSSKAMDIYSSCNPKTQFTGNPEYMLGGHLANNELNSEGIYCWFPYSAIKYYRWSHGTEKTFEYICVLEDGQHGVNRSQTDYIDC